MIAVRESQPPAASSTMLCLCAAFAVAVHGARLFAWKYAPEEIAPAAIEGESVEVALVESAPAAAATNAEPAPVPESTPAPPPEPPKKEPEMTLPEPPKPTPPPRLATAATPSPKTTTQCVWLLEQSLLATARACQSLHFDDVQQVRRDHPRLGG